MGIPGLTDFIEKNFRDWEIKLIRGNLIVDGSCLVYELYKKLDWANGGQYPEYREKIIQFFGRLDAAKVSPIVVLDGTVYKTEKVPTILSRRKQRVKRIHMCLYHDDKNAFEYCDDVLPALAFMVFRKTLIEFGIPFIVVVGEADIAVSQLANHYSCPVLAADSDYYMFNLKGGYISLASLDLQASPVDDCPVRAKVFHVKAFARQFHFGDANLRLIIPAMVGNDFLNPFHGMNIHIYQVVAASHAAMEHRLSPLVAYASSFKSLEEFLKHIPSLHLESNSDSMLRSNCVKTRELYDSEVTQSLDQLREKTEIHKLSGEIIPEWFTRQFHNGHLSKFVMDSLIQEKCIPQIAVDDTKSESAHVLSLPLRQYIYSLLGADSVAEYIRQEKELLSVRVTAIPVLGERRLPSLEEVSKLSDIERKEMLYSILGCNSKKLDDLPEDWRLVIASIIFWATKVHPSRNLLNALLSCLIMCSSSKKTEPLEIRLRPQQRGQWIHALHVFSQWQSCFLVADNLNALLMEPLKNISPASLYDGKIAMRFYFMRRELTESHAQLLYLKLCVAVSAHMCTDEQASETSSTHKKGVASAEKSKKEKRGNPKKPPKVKRTYASPISLKNRFAALDQEDVA